MQNKVAHMLRTSPPATHAVVIGVHGGAGASTLARALQLPEATNPAGDGVAVLVARTTATAADAVIRTVAALPATTVVVVALTGDGPLRPPDAVTAMRRLLADRLAGVVELPWQPRWRHEHPAAATADRAWTTAAVDLHRLAVDLAARTPTTFEGATA